MRKVGANDYLDEGLAAQLVGLFRHSRVLDLGAGLGHYGAYLRARVPRPAGGPAHQPRACRPAAACAAASRGSNRLLAATCWPIR